MGLFAKDAQEVGERIADLARDEGLSFVEAAQKILEDITIGAEIRHELTVHGGAGLASSIAAGRRARNFYTTPQRGDPPETNSSKPLNISEDFLEAARTYLIESQLVDRFGKQRRLIEFEREDWKSTSALHRGEEAGHRAAAERAEQVEALLEEEGVEVTGDLSDKSLVKAARILRRE